MASGRGEADTLGILQICQEALLHQSLLCPAPRVGQNAVANLVAVVGAVIHALHRHRCAAGEIALIQQRRQLAHHQHRLASPLQIGGSNGVALFGDGEADHLQGGRAEDLRQTRPVFLKLRIRLQALGNGGNHPLLNGAVGFQQHQQAQIVIGAVGLVDDLIVKALCHNNAPVIIAGIQRLLKHRCGKCTENIARAEVDPGGLGIGLLPDCLQVKFGESVAILLPGLRIKGMVADFR